MPAPRRALPLFVHHSLLAAHTRACEATIGRTLRACCLGAACRRVEAERQVLVVQLSDGIRVLCQSKWQLLAEQSSMVRRR